MRLIMLPGLGADERLFAGMKDHLPGLEVLSWIKPARGESLASYSRRLAQRVEADAPLVIGGVSMGGMVATEMVRHVRPRGLVMISSAMDSDSLARFRPLERLLRILPVGTLPRIAARRPMIRAICGPLSREHQELFRDMLGATPATFVRWGARAILHWRGADPGDAPVLRIHGERDRLIPAAEGARVIPDAGHLCALSHARETAEAISGWMARLS